MVNSKATTLSEAIFNQVLQHSFGLSMSARFSRLTITEGQGVYLKDADGNWYLDLHAGPAVMSTGHGHPVVLSAIEKQLHRLVHCHDLASPARLELHERLGRMVSRPPRRIALLSGGAESVELALRLARGYTGRDNIVVFSGAFHGKTLGALGCTDPMFREGWWCKSPYIYRIPYAEYQHSFLNHNNSLDFGAACAEHAIKQIESSCPTLPAALLVEPAQGSAGNIFPPPGFLDNIFSYCRKRSILIIADEILTGCGRTGKFLATEDIPVQPDIVLLGKGLGSGYPIGAVLPTELIASSPVADSIGSSSTSYGGNPLAATVAAATLRVIEEEELVKNSAGAGKVLLQGLHELAVQHEFVKNVRGRGLMLGFDLDPIPGSDIGEKLFISCLENGLMIMGLGNRVRLNPPLIFRPEHVDEAISKLDRALTTLSRYYR